MSRATIIDLDAHQVSSLLVFGGVDVLFKIKVRDKYIFLIQT